MGSRYCVGKERNAMAIKWNDLMHKSSPKVRANLKREADAELERIGFHTLRQTGTATTAGGLNSVAGTPDRRGFQTARRRG